MFAVCVVEGGCASEFMFDDLEFEMQSYLFSVLLQFQAFAVPIVQPYHGSFSVSWMSE